VALLRADGSLDNLKTLCGRCLYRTLASYVRVHGLSDATVVLTGDIPAMWLRDSAVQIATYLPRIARHPGLRPIVEGTVRSQAYFVLQDPYANAFNPSYVKPSSLGKGDRQLGRGGWVWTRNFELDSLAYFFNLLWNYHATPGLWRSSALLAEPLVHDAVVTALRVLKVEQRHEEASPYRCVSVVLHWLNSFWCYIGFIHFHDAAAAPVAVTAAAADFWARRC
jgi:meiotically up-regulated gene 157 (Mug157) protein